MNTVWVEFTKRCWRPAVERTLFGHVARLGWIGVGVSQHNLTAWVNAWRTALERAKSASGQNGGKGQQK